MTPFEKLDRLSLIARMMLDRDLAALRQAANAKSASEARLADLAATPPATDLPVVAAQVAELRWQKWADQRRAEVNLMLARQTADWIEARENAQRAFAKGEALRAVRKRFDQPS